MVMLGASATVFSVVSANPVASVAVVATLVTVSNSAATDDAAFADSEATSISNFKPIICNFYMFLFCLKNKR